MFEDLPFRYEKNNYQKYFYDDAEYWEEFMDERKFGFDYVEILHKIDGGEIRAKDLGGKR